MPTAHLRQNKPFPLLYLGHAQIKSVNEAEVEEVHVEENLAAPTTKRNDVGVFKFNEKWKDGRPWLNYGWMMLKNPGD